MKKVFLMLIVLISLNCYSQEIIKYEKVITADSISKDNIFYGLKKWVATDFVSSKAVIEMADKDAGLLVISPNSKYIYPGGYIYSGYNGYISYTVNIQIKDGRFKVIITNFTHKLTNGNEIYGLGLITNSEDYPRQSYPGAKKYNNNVWDDLKIRTSVISDELFNILSNLKFESLNKNNDNW